MNNSNLDKSLNELEGWTWIDEIPDRSNSSYEEHQFYVLHAKPLKTYSLANIYFMIGQDAGLLYIIPMAIKELIVEPFLQAEDYPGDLLRRVLIIDAIYWSAHPDQFRQLFDVLSNPSNKIPFDSTPRIFEMLTEARSEFMKLNINLK